MQNNCDYGIGGGGGGYNEHDPVSQHSQSCIHKRKKELSQEEHTHRTRSHTKTHTYKYWKQTKKKQERKQPRNKQTNKEGAIVERVVVVVVMN